MLLLWWRLLLCRRRWIRWIWTMRWLWRGWTLCRRSHFHDICFFFFFKLKLLNSCHDWFRSDMNSIWNAIQWNQLVTCTSQSFLIQIDTFFYYLYECIEQNCFVRTHTIILLNSHNRFYLIKQPKKKKKTQNHFGSGRFHVIIVKIIPNKTHKMSGVFFPLTCWKFNQSCCGFFFHFVWSRLLHFLLVHTNTTSTPELCISCIIVNVFGHFVMTFSQ